MNRLRAFIVLSVFALAGCPGDRGDPPPPVASGTLPVAPPRATGALAAGRESAEPQGPAAPEAEDGEEPLAPVPTTPDDGGTSL